MNIIANVLRHKIYPCIVTFRSEQFVGDDIGINDHNVSTQTEKKNSLTFITVS